MSVLDDFSVRIYEPPLTAVRDSGAIADVTKPVHVLMLTMDFVTELEMNGITNFIGNSSGRFANETVTALREVGRPVQAKVLEQIVGVANDAGMTHAAIQQDRGGLEEFAVTSFSEVHGDKWDEASRRIDDLADQIEVEEIYSAMEAYCDQHQGEIVTAMNSKG